MSPTTQQCEDGSSATTAITGAAGKPDAAIPRVVRLLRAIPWRRRLVTVVVAATSLFVGSLAVSAALGGWYIELPVGVGKSSTVEAGAAQPGPPPQRPPGSRLPPAPLAPQKALDALKPRGVYIVIDSLRNRLRVYRNDEILREAVISAGSGAKLTDPRNGHQWTFDTPTGEHRIQRKVKNPIWVKPDWAFIEEGEPPPDPHDLASRRDDVSLGDYSLYLGDGYMLHGTLFQTLLGRGVTHGCIRLGDADLEYVYKNVKVGSRVYIY